MPETLRLEIVTPQATVFAEDVHMVTLPAIEGEMVYSAAPFRYVWPSELDLMARCCGLRRRERWSTWNRDPFTADSTTQIALFEKLG